MAESTQAAWTFEDLFFFLGAIVPSALLAAGAAGSITANSLRALVFQSVLYVLLLSALFVLARMRHQQGFAESLGWRLQFRGAWLCLAVSPFLAVAISVLGAVLRSPLMPSPVDRLSEGDIPIPIVIAFATLAGPIFEELVFRGFLQPLLAKAWGPWPGLLTAAAAFSALHGAQNEWLWQYLLLLFVAGTAFGVARHNTGSTAAAVLLHMGFNLTQLTGSLLSRN